MLNLYCRTVSLGLTFDCELCCQRKGAQITFGVKVKPAGGGSTETN